MNNMRQINIIMDALNLEKKRIFVELNKTRQRIQKRLMIINRISNYQKEYGNNETFKISHTIPTLQQNLQAFTNRIAQLIAVEEKEISKLSAISDSITKQLDGIERKIKLMTMFEDKIINFKNQRIEQLEQRLADDLATIKSSEQDHE